MIKKAYFLSDAHLGMFPAEKSLEREKKLVQWMEGIKKDALELYLVGDIFDFWYEYKKVVPKGFTRFLGKLTEYSDLGIPVYFFTGNHDVWAFDYLATECGAKIINKPLEREILGRKFYIAHGDGLGPGDKAYLLLKRCFHNPFLQWMFSRLHPNLAMTLGQAWSKKSRLTKGVYGKFHGKNEWLVQHAGEVLKKAHFDYFIFGHRHIPMNLDLDGKSKLICLGDWIMHFSYAVFDGEEMKLVSYKDSEKLDVKTDLKI